MRPEIAVLVMAGIVAAGWGIVRAMTAYDRRTARARARARAARQRQRPRPTTALVPFGGPYPPPNPTEITVRRLEREIAALDAENQGYARLIDECMAELELRPAADPMVRYTVAQGPTSTGKLADLFDTTPGDVDSRMLRSDPLVKLLPFRAPDGTAAWAKGEPDGPALPGSAWLDDLVVDADIDLTIRLTRPELERVNA